MRWSSSLSCSKNHWFIGGEKSDKEITVMSNLLSKTRYLSVVYLLLAERSLRTGPGSMVGSPVADVVVVQVDEILLSNPGGRLRLRR